jgi:hypothetical protein
MISDTFVVLLRQWWWSKIRPDRKLREENTHSHTLFPRLSITNPG